MPNQSPSSARTANARFQVRDPRLLVQPHSAPSFWRLFGLHQQQTRPIIFDQAYGDEIAELSAAAYTGRSLTLGGSDRFRRYDIFEEMDNFGLVSAVLDAYSEEATQPDYDRGVRVWVESKSAPMVKAGEECLRNLQVEDRIVPITRRMCKYGDAFQRLLYSSGKGVIGWRFVRQHDVERVEDKYGRLVGFRENGELFRKGLHTSGVDTSFPWDYLHFRLLGKHEEDGYGTGLLERMFREWRYMTLTEDALLMYRLRRAPDRNLVMVDVGSLEDHEAMRYVNQWRKRLRKHELVDPSTPDYKKQYNPLTPLEDIFIPIRQDTNTRIEPLSGSGNIGEVYDLEHFRDAFFGAAAVPKAYFGFEGEINAKATLQQQDVRFARACKRVQRGVMFGMRQVLDVHYTLLRAQEGGDEKFDFARPSNAYLVQMSPISYLDEFERLELVQMRNGILEGMSRTAETLKLDARAWSAYLLLNFAKLPEDLVMRLISQTPSEPPTGGGPPPPPAESLSGSPRDQVFDTRGEQRKGFYQLSESEKRAIGRLVGSSPSLRRSIANFAELAEEENPGSIAKAMLQQTDPALLPLTLKGVDLLDSYKENPKVRELMEDLEILKDPAKMAAHRSRGPAEGTSSGTVGLVEDVFARRR